MRASYNWFAANVGYVGLEWGKQWGINFADQFGIDMLLVRDAVLRCRRTINEGDWFAVLS